MARVNHHAQGALPLCRRLGNLEVRQTRPERSSNGRVRFEEEVPRREARIRSERRNHHHSSDEEDESDDEGRGEKPTKRAKQDKTLFNWAADAFIKRSILSPKHRKIIQEIENFKLDLDEAIESIEQSGVNPIFPKRLWKSVLRDEYIELAEVHALVSTYHHPEAPRPASNKFADALELSTLVKPTPTKAIIDQITWRRAWRATADAISFAFTNRRSELVAYEEHIGRLFDDNLTSFHRNILNYDKAVRQLIGSRRDILTACKV
ncbi:hypothetical protein EV368DRAFT_43117 [Lentinula lateritia]|nr:hypothetical protein EV368DRAFT_43117 [Lentinula lateritia]